MRMAHYEQQTMNPSQIDVAFVFAFIQCNCTLRLIYTEEKRFHFLSSLSLLNVNINSFGRLVDLCGLLLKSSKWTIWPNPLNLQGGLKVSNHLLAEWSRVDFLLYPYCH